MKHFFIIVALLCFTQISLAFNHNEPKDVLTPVVGDELHSEVDVTLSGDVQASGSKSFSFTGKKRYTNKTTAGASSKGTLTVSVYGHKKSVIVVYSTSNGYSSSAVIPVGGSCCSFSFPTGNNTVVSFEIRSDSTFSGSAMVAWR